MAVLGLLEILIILAIVFAIAMAVKSGNKTPLIAIGVMLLVGGVLVFGSFMVKPVAQYSGGAVSNGVRMKIGMFPILLIPVAFLGTFIFSKVENKKKVLTTILITGVIITLGIMGIRMFNYQKMTSSSAQYTPPQESSN